MAFVIDEDAPFDIVATELREYLAKQNGLWSRGDITVNVGLRMLARDELALIKSIIETHSGLKVTRFWCSPEALGEGAFEIEPKTPLVEVPDPIPLRPADNEVTLPDSQSTTSVKSVIDDLKKRKNESGASSVDRTEALLIKSTFRSGETLHHPGDVVVLANVNPGAEIRADGDIVVLGSLKGWAHAGASGDIHSVIIALELPSLRFEIGKYQGVAPSQARLKFKPSASGPKIAYVRNRCVHVAPFKGWFAKYSKGVRYDG